VSELGEGEMTMAEKLVLTLETGTKVSSIYFTCDGFQRYWSTGMSHAPLVNPGKPGHGSSGLGGERFCLVVGADLIAQRVDPNPFGHAATRTRGFLRRLRTVSQELDCDPRGIVGARSHSHKIIALPLLTAAYVKIFP
jgi:hypothetical protein